METGTLYTVNVVARIGVMQVNEEYMEVFKW